jgi:ATP-dependent Clp endopeptidase proteolytic subunit ClpP
MSNWYAFSPRASDAQEVELAIYDEIGFFGVTAKDFAQDLKEHSGRHVHLRINSVGGSVIEGNAIFNALKRHKGGLTVHVDGLAASMASVIAMTGERTLMAENAMMMIHNPWSMAMGDADQLRKEADTLDKIKKVMVGAYRRKSGKDSEEIAAIMDDETWLTAAEAKEAGFVDEIEDGTEAAASLTPESARARFDKLKDFMARKPATIKAEEAAPEVEAPAVEPETPETVETPEAESAEEVDTSAEDMSIPSPDPAELQAKLAALEAAQAESAELSAKEVESLKAEIDRLTSEVASRDEELNALRAASKSAGEQAAAIVAGVGVDPVLAQPELTPAQRFATLTGDEATAYFRAHKSEILRTLNS